MNFGMTVLPISLQIRCVFIDDWRWLKKRWRKLWRKLFINKINAGNSTSVSESVWTNISCHPTALFQHILLQPSGSPLPSTSFTVQSSVYTPPPCLSSLYLSFLLSSWLEYWWGSLWIWLSPRSAESDSRHKYLGASERKTSWLKRTECRSGFYPWWKSMRLDRSQSDSTCQL